MKLMIGLLLTFGLTIFAKEPLTKRRLNKLSGEDIVSLDEKTFWDTRYNKKSYIYGKLPAKFLAENFDYLSGESSVLDLGMGEGRNAVFLAEKGHMVTGIDISSIAVRKAKYLAKEKNVKLKTLVASVAKYDFPKNHFDAIICFYYVDRKLNEKILSWLKPGGILVYEAFTLHEYKKSFAQTGDKNHFLRPGELLAMFSNTRILKYEEPLHEGKYRASIILQKKGKI